VLPRDRWMGLRPQSSIGQVTFKPWQMEAGTRLTLNADASEGEFRVEWLDASGYRINGYTQADMNPLNGDHLEHQPSWHHGSRLAMPSGQYQLRVHLKDATLYAITLYPPQTP